MRQLPNASRHCPDPFYLRELVRRIRISQAGVAQLLGVSPRQFRYYLSTASDHVDAPYTVQYALEVLAGV